MSIVSPIFPLYEDPEWCPDLEDYPPYNITDVDDIPYLGPAIDIPIKKKNPAGPYNFGLKIVGEKNKKRYPDQYLDAKLVAKWSEQLGHSLYDGSFVYTTINARNKRLANIDYLQLYHDIKIIDFSHNRLYSILSLSELQWVKILNLENNFIGQPSNIPTFPFLHAMTLFGNGLKTAKGFLYQPKLHYMNLAGNSITTVEGLDSNVFPNLKTLELRGNKLTSLKGLVFPKLQHLYVAQNKITTMADLIDVPNIISFHARTNKIENVSDFPTVLNSLMYLNLRNNLISKHTQVLRFGYSPLRALILTDCPISKGAKYRLETITSIICLIRLDKTIVAQSDISTSMYLRLQRDNGSLPPLRDELLALTPPPTPASDWTKEKSSQLQKMASQLDHLPDTTNVEPSSYNNVSKTNIGKTSSADKRTSLVPQKSKKELKHGRNSTNNRNLKGTADSQHTRNSGKTRNIDVTKNSKMGKNSKEITGPASLDKQSRKDLKSQRQEPKD